MTNKFFICVPHDWSVSCKWAAARGFGWEFEEAEPPDADSALY